jgi:IS5 family transposase
VAAELTNCASDANELPTLLQAVRANLEQSPQQVLADTGYRSEAVFEKLADCATELVVSLGREGKQQLRFDPERSPHTALMAEKLQSKHGKASYRKRKWIAEPPNGWVKNVLGFRQFSMRGLHRVTAEWKLVCMALNLRRMATPSGS